MRDVECQGSESTYVADAEFVAAGLAFQRRLCGKSILVGEVASKVGSADPRNVSRSNVSSYIALVTNFG